MNHIMNHVAHILEHICVHPHTTDDCMVEWLRAQGLNRYEAEDIVHEARLLWREGAMPNERPRRMRVP